MNNHPDPAFEAALAHAQVRGCCGNENYRGRLCEYHQGFEDGYDAAIRDADHMVREP